LAVEEPASKAALRTRILAARRSLPLEDRLAAGHAIGEVVVHLASVEAARCVAAYVSYGTELSTAELLEVLLERKVRVLVPMIGASERLELGWADYRGPDGLRVRRPGRPAEPAGPVLAPAELAKAEVVLVPALAVDTAGSRLGYGAGWYDQALGYAAPGAELVALVYDGEVFDATTCPLPHEPHDKTVSSVATPSGWRALGASLSCVTSRKCPSRPLPGNL
jgi:5-formyltetrahydrofolate cyclo-ligase